MGKPSKHFNSIVAYLALVTGVLMVYRQVAGHHFNDFDDSTYIFDNHYVLSGLTWEGVRWAFTNFDAANWHPLTWLSHMVDRNLFGAHPGAYFMENVVWHAAAACLVFHFFKRLLNEFGLAFFIAAVFALHPANVEVVAWASQRKSLLSVFFWMLALIGYLNYVDRPSKRRYIILSGWFALSLLSKAMSVSLPVILLLIDFWPLHRIEGVSENSASSTIRPQITLKSALLEKLPLVVLAGLISLATFIAQKAGGAVASVELFSISQRVFNSAEGYFQYLGLFFWPSKLCLYYPYIDFGMTVHVAALAGLLSLCLLALFLHRKAPWFLFGWFWFIIVLIPMIGIIQVGTQAYADRYLYFPEIGLTLIAGYAFLILNRKIGGTVAIGALASATLIALGAKTYFQTAYWQTGETLFKNAIHVSGPTPNMVTDLGVSYLRDQKFDLALGCFNRVPDSFRPEVTLANRAAAAMSLGKTDEALMAFEKAAAINPDHANYQLTLANIYYDRQDFAKALCHYDMAMRCIEKADSSSIIGQAIRADLLSKAEEYERLRKKISAADGTPKA